MADVKKKQKGFVFKDTMNPYRKESQYDPNDYLKPAKGGSGSNGFCMIEKPIMWVMIEGVFTKAEMRVLLKLIEWSRGFSRDYVRLYSRDDKKKSLQNAVKMKGTNTLSKALKGLYDKKIIYIYHKDNGYITFRDRFDLFKKVERYGSDEVRIGINYRIDTWDIDKDILDRVMVQVRQGIGSGEIDEGGSTETQETTNDSSLDKSDEEWGALMDEYDALDRDKKE